MSITNVHILTKLLSFLISPVEKISTNIEFFKQLCGKETFSFAYCQGN